MCKKVTRNSKGNSSLVEDKYDEWRKMEKTNLRFFQKWFPGTTAGGCLNPTTGVVIKFYYNTWMKQIMILHKYAVEEH